MWRCNPVGYRFVNYTRILSKYGLMMISNVVGINS